MEQSSSFCGRRTGTQRRKNKKILQGPQESFQAREVSRIYARTKSNRTVLEACQEIFVKQASENHACCKISFEKNFQKERLYAQNVPLFKRLAIIREENPESEKLNAFTQRDNLGFLRVQLKLYCLQKLANGCLVIFKPFP